MNTRRSGMVRWGLGMLCAAVSGAACAAPPGAYGADRRDPPDDTSGASLLPAAPAANDLPASNNPSAPPAAPPSSSVTSEAPLPMNVVLEDFVDGDGRLSSGSFAGRWHTYSDGTGQ